MGKTIADLIWELEEIIENLKPDANKFDDKDNAAAGTRVRVGLQSVKKKAQEIRIAIQDRKKK